MRIGIIGGAGFLGQRLTATLQRDGHAVVVGDIVQEGPSSVPYRRCDVRDIQSVKAFAVECDVLYNLAAEHRDDVRPLERYWDVNVRGAQNVCQAASDAGIRTLRFTSSVAVYGIPEGRATEDSPCRPFNEYGRTKLEAEKVYQTWASADATRSLVIVRPTVIFGEGNRGNVFNLARQVASSYFVMIGNGRNRKSMAYVENVSDFLWFTLRHGNGTHIYNYSDEPDYDMNGLVAVMRASLGRAPSAAIRVPHGVGLAIGYAFDALARVARRPLPVSAVRIKKFCASTEIDSQRAFASGFRPAVSLPDALARFMRAEFEPGRSEAGRDIPA